MWFSVVEGRWRDGAVATVVDELEGVRIAALRLISKQ